MTWRRASHCGAQIIIKHQDVVKFIGHWVSHSNRDCRGDPTSTGSWVRGKWGEWQETGDGWRDDWGAGEKWENEKVRQDQRGVIKLWWNTNRKLKEWWGKCGTYKKVRIGLDWIYFTLVFWPIVVLPGVRTVKLLHPEQNNLSWFLFFYFIFFL